MGALISFLNFKTRSKKRRKFPYAYDLFFPFFAPLLRFFLHLLVAFSKFLPFFHDYFALISVIFSSFFKNFSSILLLIFSQFIFNCFLSFHFFCFFLIIFLYFLPFFCSFFIFIFFIILFVSFP